MFIGEEKVISSFGRNDKLPLSVISRPASAPNTNAIPCFLFLFFSIVNGRGVNKSRKKGDHITQLVARDGIACEDIQRKCP